MQRYFCISPIRLILHSGTTYIHNEVSMIEKRSHLSVALTTTNRMVFANKQVISLTSLTHSQYLQEKYSLLHEEPEALAEETAKTVTAGNTPMVAVNTSITLNASERI